MCAFRTVVFANGELPDLEHARALLRPDDFLIAADGGLRHIKSLGLRPHLLIGDLDSVLPEDLLLLQSEGVEIRRHPVEKDETDLELALTAAAEKADDILVVAGLGGRLDHTLGNLYLLLAPRLAGLEIRLDDGIEEAFWIRCAADLTGQPGDRVSLLPLLGPVEGVVTTRLRYPLKAETLYPEHTRGISNEMITRSARVSVAAGVLLCIHTRHFGVHSS